MVDNAVPDSPVPVHAISALAAGPADETVYPTTADSPAFWLYTSGTTGRAKAAMHRHGAIPVVCETYGQQVLGIRPDDRCLSAAKAFFAYGLGNSLLFPFSVGAAAVLEPARSTPDVIAGAAQKHGASLFFAGPTFFANMLRAGLPGDALRGVRLAASAGEALPASLYQRWTGHFGVDILDGIGMTEMLHIFLSNRPGEVRPGSTGVAVPGYDLKLLDEAGQPVPAGHAGHAVRARRLHRHRVLVPLRRVPPGVPGRVAAHRRHLPARPGRLLRLPGPDQRHAQGQRHVGVPGRGGGPAAGPPGGGPGGGGVGQRHRTGWKSRWLM